MPSLKEVQHTALEVVDYLYFYDIFAAEAFDDEKKAVYCRLLNAIEHILSARNFLPAQYEIYKHYLLCGVEILTTQHSNIKIGKVNKSLTEQQKDEAYKQINQQRLNIACKALLKELHNSGHNTEHFYQDVVTLIHLTQIDEASEAVSFRLVSQVLWTEFKGSIATYVYRKFVELKILSKKFHPSIYDSNEPENEYLFLRAMLFIEFEILRKKLHCEHDIKILNQMVSTEKISESLKKKRENYYQKNYKLFTSSDFLRIYKYDLTNKSQVEAYLVNISPSLCHNRIFTDQHGVWVSLLAAWHLNYEWLTTKKSIYLEANNNGTCSDTASIIMKKNYGLAIDAKTLYLNHKKVRQFYEFIYKSTSKMVDEFECGFISPDLSSFFYYHNVMSESLNAQLDEFIKTR